jgi:hypothetical protein
MLDDNRISLRVLKKMSRDGETKIKLVRPTGGEKESQIKASNYCSQTAITVAVCVCVCVFFFWGGGGVKMGKRM